MGIEQGTDQFDKESDIVVICHHGIRSRQVAKYLESLLYNTDGADNKLINLEGGIHT